MDITGGTSLTKCYQLLDRFSEDIDISYSAESGIPCDARKKQLKKAVVATIESLELTINNLDQTRSKRHYNCYRANYPSIYNESLFLKPELVVETYVALLPFPITTQSIERTFADKVYALCDYYLENKIDRHSRHLYDIHKIYTQLEISTDFSKLVSDVRTVRSKLPICPSAKMHISINALLTEIINQNIYKKDYENITEGLLFFVSGISSFCFETSKKYS